MADHPWIICHDGTQGELAYAIECRRCGQVQKIATPISIDCYVAMGKAFEKMHKRCRERQAEAKDG